MQDSISHSKGDSVSWGVKMDGMESDLVKDFDENLSGLGLELGANAYNMSEVLNLPIFKQESVIGNQGLPPLQYMLCAPTSPASKVYITSFSILIFSRTSGKLYISVFYLYIFHHCTWYIFSVMCTEVAFGTQTRRVVLKTIKRSHLFHFVMLCDYFVMS